MGYEIPWRSHEVVELIEELRGVYFYDRLTAKVSQDFETKEQAETAWREGKIEWR